MSIHWGSLIAGLVIGLIVYHLMKGRTSVTS